MDVPVTELALALEPFARIADDYDGNAGRSSENPWGGGHEVLVRLADCRKARSTLDLLLREGNTTESINDEP